MGVTMRADYEAIFILGQMYDVSTINDCTIHFIVGHHEGSFSPISQLVLEKQWESLIHPFLKNHVINLDSKPST